MLNGMNSQWLSFPFQVKFLRSWILCVTTLQASVCVLSMKILLTSQQYRQMKNDCSRFSLWYLSTCLWMRLQMVTSLSELQMIVQFLTVSKSKFSRLMTASYLTRLAFRPLTLMSCIMTMKFIRITSSPSVLLLSLLLSWDHTAK